MQPMSRPDVNPGATETQQMRITTPIGVSIEFLYLLRRRFFFLSSWLTLVFLVGGGPAYRPTSGYAYEYRIRWVGGPSKIK